METSSESAKNATAEKARLQREAQDRLKQGIPDGKKLVLFEYTVRESTQNPANVHELITKEKGTQERLPRAVAERKQAHGLGWIIEDTDGNKLSTPPKPEATGPKFFGLKHDDDTKVVASE